VAHVEGVGPVVNEPALTARVAGVTRAMGADKVTMEGVDKPARPAARIIPPLWKRAWGNRCSS
jgi:hypothetical protein